MSEQTGYRAYGQPTFNAPAFEPTEAFSWALAEYRAEPQRVAVPLIVVAFAIVITATVVPAMVSGTVGLITAVVGDSWLSTLLQWVGHAITAGTNLVVDAYAMAAGYAFVLNVARGRPVEFADLFKHVRRLPRMTALLFVISVAAAAGSVFCALPGAFCVVVTSMAPLLLVDMEIDALSALRKSWELSRPQLLPLFIFALLSLVAVLVGLLFCFVGAVFVSIPVVLLAQSYVYLRLTGGTPIPV
jgi:uncharacterized membrane protein